MSDAGCRLIRDFEGMVLHLYDDPGPGRNCTIGIGHLVHLGPSDGRAEEAPYANGITEAQAYDLLRRDLDRFSAAVDEAVVVPLRQPQFDALVSFAFNVGEGAFRTSTLVRLLNEGRYDQVRPQLMRWTGADGRQLEGLVRRRRAEADLFESHGQAPARSKEVEMLLYAAPSTGGVWLFTGSTCIPIPTGDDLDKLRAVGVPYVEPVSEEFHRRVMAAVGQLVEQT
jgi:lysozyme